MSEVINGVSRELLERLLDSDGIDGVFDAGKNYDAHQELRALLTAQPQASVCETMGRPKAECGCPDCGSSLIEWPQASAAEVGLIVDAALAASAGQEVKP